MKKLIALILTAIMFTAVPVHADQIDDRIEKIEKQIDILQAQLDKLKKQKEASVIEEPEEENQYVLSDTNGELTFTSFDTITKNDKLYAILYFDFRSVSNKEIAPSSVTDITAFQNGMQISNAYLYDDNIPELDNIYKQIMFGTTIPIAYSYELYDMSDVTVVMKSRVYGSDKQSRFTFNPIQQ